MSSYLKLKKEKPIIAKKGLVIAYIGDGKGKTTAAMGLVARASGAKLRVFILQFVKAKAPEDGEHLKPGEWPLSSEINFFERCSDSNLGSVETEQVGSGFVGILGDKKEKSEHIRQALKGLDIARKAILSGEYEVVILDEIISALELKLIEQQDILDLLLHKPQMLHIVLTGHKKFPKILKQCDLVTEMKLVKHPYYEGVLAQKGIDY